MMKPLSFNQRQKLKLLALIGLFAAPVVTAWAMVEWRVGIPDERVAHGELMPDMPRLAQWPLKGDPASLETDAWVLAYDCQAGCAGVADRLWRLHRALGREAPRVTRLRLGGAQAALPGEEVVHWQARPAWSNGEAMAWLIDFDGRVVLSYRHDEAPSEILKDIRRLLRMNPEIERISKE